MFIQPMKTITGMNFLVFLQPNMTCDDHDVPLTLNTYKNVALYHTCARATDPCLTDDRASAMVAAAAVHDHPSWSETSACRTDRSW